MCTCHMNKAFIDEKRHGKVNESKRTYSFANTPLNAAQAPLATAKNIQCFLHDGDSGLSILAAAEEEEEEVDEVDEEVDEVDEEAGLPVLEVL